MRPRSFFTFPEIASRSTSAWAWPSMGFKSASKVTTVPALASDAPLCRSEITTALPLTHGGLRPLWLYELYVIEVLHDVTFFSSHLGPPGKRLNGAWGWTQRRDRTRDAVQAMALGGGRARGDPAGGGAGAGARDV